MRATPELKYGSVYMTPLTACSLLKDQWQNLFIFPSQQPKKIKDERQRLGQSLVSVRSHMKKTSKTTLVYYLSKVTLKTER